MTRKIPRQLPPKTIRVAIVGNHPWTDNLGVIESLLSGKFEVFNVLGTDMLKVKLDSGHECFASKENLRIFENKPKPVPPPPPRNRGKFCSGPHSYETLIKPRDGYNDAALRPF